MKPVFYISFLSTLLIFSGSITGCQRGDESTNTEPAPADPPTNRIEIPRTVQSNLGITFAKVERRQVAKTLRLPGAFELQPLAAKEYRLILDGVVDLKVDQLDPVNAGDLLFVVRSLKWLELQARIESATATLIQKETLLKSVEDRIQALSEANFKRADLETRRAELVAEVERQKVEQEKSVRHAIRILNLNSGSGAETIWTPQLLMETVEINGKTTPRYATMEQIEVRATEPGRVEALFVANGAFAETGDLILRTIQPEKVRFRALALQSDLPHFSPGQSAHIVPYQTPEGNLNESIEASLIIGTQADPNHRTLVVYGIPTELKSWSRPGISAWLEVVTESSGGMTLAIPKSAIVQDGLTHVFFKRDPMNPNRAIRVEADMGADDGRWVSILSGIGPNDEVVLNGAYELKLATEKSGKSQEGGHFHADGSYHGDH